MLIDMVGRASGAGQLSLLTSFSLGFDHRRVQYMAFAETGRPVRNGAWLDRIVWPYGLWAYAHMAMAIWHIAYGCTLRT